MKSTLSLLLLAGLLCGPLFSHAAAPAPAPARKACLDFSIEQHPGKADWISCSLEARGAFSIHATLSSMRGQLPEQESLRLLAEFDQLCLAAGEEHFPRRPRTGGGGRLRPCFHYLSSQGLFRELEGPRTPPPPALTEFMRSLWRTLFFHASASPISPQSPAAASASQSPYTRLRPPINPALSWRRP